MSESSDKNELGAGRLSGSSRADEMNEKLLRVQSTLTLLQEPFFTFAGESECIEGFFKQFVPYYGRAPEEAIVQAIRRHLKGPAYAICLSLGRSPSIEEIYAHLARYFKPAKQGLARIREIIYLGPKGPADSAVLEWTALVLSMINMTSAPFTGFRKELTERFHPQSARNELNCCSSSEEYFQMLASLLLARKVAVVGLEKPYERKRTPPYPCPSCKANHWLSECPQKQAEGDKR